MSEWSNSSAVVNTVVSVIALVVSVVSVFLVYIQIKQTNKLNLFKRRLDIWTIVNGLMKLCKASDNFFLNKDNDPLCINDYIFTRMTNSSYLYNIKDIINNPLEQTHLIDFLNKLEELTNVASEIEFLFNDDISSLMSGFVNDYHDYLFTSYQYQTVLQEIKKVGEEEPLHKKQNMERAASSIGELSIREELYVCMDKLLASFNKINSDKVKQEIKNQIRIKY